MATFDFMSASSEDMSDRSNGSVGRLMVMGLLLLPGLVTNSILFCRLLQSRTSVRMFFSKIKVCGTRFCIIRDLRA